MKRILQNSIYLLIPILAINLLSSFLFFRLDFTMNKRYSLSKVSKNIVKKIPYRLLSIFISLKTCPRT